MYAVFQSEPKPKTKVVVTCGGFIGMHIAKAHQEIEPRQNKSDRKRNRKERWR